MRSKRITKAAILAGGKGTRLYPVTRTVPKSLIKIGNLPLIEHQILLLKEHGIEEIFVLAGCLGKEIKKQLQDGRKWNIRINCWQEETPLGTAGAIKTLAGKIKEDFLVISGDVMLNLDLNKFIKWHQLKGIKIGSLVVHKSDHPLDSDLVELDKSERIISFLLRPHPEGKVLPDLSIASVFIFSPKIFEYVPEKEKTDIEKDILPALLKSKEIIYGYNTLDYIKDMGTPERLEKTREDFISGKIKRQKRYEI